MLVKRNKEKEPRVQAVGNWKVSLRTTPLKEKAKVMRSITEHIRRHLLKNHSLLESGPERT
jgi:hypothetical protein